jgi:hypothetical protein
MVEIDVNSRTPQRAPMVVPDIPDYVSPVSGKLVSGRRQRRDDLKRTNSREWEGMQSEINEARRRVRYEEQRSDARLHEAVAKSYHQLSPAQRKILEGR